MRQAVYHVPYAIHTRTGQPDALGAPPWSRAFEQRVNAAFQATPLAQRRRQWTRWWEVPGAYDFLIAQYDAAAVDAVFAVCQGSDLKETARGIGASARTLDALKWRCANAIRDQFLQGRYD